MKTKSVDLTTGEVTFNAPSYKTVPVEETPFFKTPHNFDRDAESASSGLLCEDASRTQQQFTKDADINNILRKFQIGQGLPLTGPPVYGDAQEGDLQDMIVTRSQVDEAWNALPSAVRNILKDPKTFADYVDHCIQTGDLDPLVELGLANAKVPEQAIGGTPAPESPPPAKPEQAPSGA